MEAVAVRGHLDFDCNLTRLVSPKRQGMMGLDIGGASVLLCCRASGALREKPGEVKLGRKRNGRTYEGRF